MHNLPLHSAQSPHHKPTRTFWLDALRLMCTYAVVCMHVNRLFDLHPVDVDLANNMHSEMMTRLMLQMGIPLFMSVSGFTFSKLLLERWASTTRLIAVDFTLLKKRFTKLIGLALLAWLTVVPVERFASAKANGFEQGFFSWISERTIQEWINPGVVWFLFVLFIYWLLNWRIALMWIHNAYHHSMENCCPDSPSHQNKLPTPNAYSRRRNLFQWITRLDWKGFFYQEVALCILAFILMQVDRFVGGEVDDFQNHSVTKNIPNLETNPMFVAPLKQQYNYAPIFIFNTFFMYHVMWLTSIAVGYLRHSGRFSRIVPLCMQALLIANQILLFLRFDPPPASSNRFKLTVHTIVHTLLSLNAYFLFGYQLHLHKCIEDVDTSTKHHQIDSKQKSIEKTHEDSAVGLSNMQRIAFCLLLPFTPLIFPDSSSGFISADRTYLEPASRILYELGCFVWMYWFYNVFRIHFKNTSIPTQYQRYWRFIYGGQLFLYLFHSMWLYILVFFLQNSRGKFWNVMWKYVLLQAATPTMCYVTYGLYLWLRGKWKRNRGLEHIH